MVKLSIFAVIAAVTVSVLADRDTIDVCECVDVNSDGTSDVHIACCIEAGGKASDNECKYDRNILPSAPTAFESCCSSAGGKLDCHGK
ncbi:hypothetical protein BDC45DRAFT_502478 [Circinella umbellata]|nr:hypothetical protein BDC45DRAFT_502478 [Circinella umbellata]